MFGLTALRRLLEDVSVLRETLSGIESELRILAVDARTREDRIAAREKAEADAATFAVPGELARLERLAGAAPLETLVAVLGRRPERVVDWVLVYRALGGVRRAALVAATPGRAAPAMEFLGRTETLALEDVRALNQAILQDLDRSWPLNDRADLLAELIADCEPPEAWAEAARRLAASDPVLADSASRRLAGLDVVLRLDDLSVQHLLRETDYWVLLTALTAEPPAVKERLQANMGRRAALLLEDDLAATPAASSEELGNARRAIGAMLRLLVRQGRIPLPPAIA